MRLVRAMAGVVMVLGLCGAALNAQTTKKTAKPTKVGPEAAYCTATGGLVEVRYAVYGTNNSQQNWLPLAGVEPFCQYTLAADGSRIHLSLDTLFTTKPTLAALYYCTQLGGAEIGATDLAGGGWVATSGIDEILEACVFPDNSTIDSWGLFYHSDSIIRGIDLSTVLKYSNPYPGKK
jgi:putative hemolysin